MLTTFDPTHSLNGNAPAKNRTPLIQVEGLSVCYRVPLERIPSFKEYAIRWLKGQVRYQEFWALLDVNLEIYPGEVVGIVGPNGAGKSTLLKTVARVLRPTRGRVRVNGRVAPLLELGAGFDYELTGRENVYLNSAVLGYSKQNIDSRFDRIIDFAGLREFIDLPLRTYSTGMVARLGFSIATDVRPDLLIVDEILGVGDAEFQNKSFERIQGFQAAGTTILLVSHSLERVREVCSRTFWLDRGKIIASGSVDSVIGQYLDSNREKEAQALQTQITAQRAAEVEADAPPSEAVSQRWGSRKIEITGVRITDVNGVEQSVFETGQTLVLHIDYFAHQPIVSPLFGMAIHRQDGFHITGPNTGAAGLDLETVVGAGTVRYVVPKLPLLEGLYPVSVAVVSHDDRETFDYHDRLYPFKVLNRIGTQREKFGLVTFSGQWSLESRRS